MLEISQLRCFVAVGEELHFGRAAERLNMTQPPLSRQIRLLEHQVGTLLLERTNRSVIVLTAVTVIALPINLTAGLFGMNVGGIPLAEDPEGFWRVLLLVLLMTAGAAWYAFRRGPE